MRLLIVDAVAHTRNSLKNYLQLHEDIEIVGETAAAATTLHLCHTLQPDMIIMDVNLPDTDGFTVTRQLLTMPQPPVIILLTIHLQGQDMIQAQAAGAAVCIEKSAGVDPILEAIFSFRDSGRH
jgi:DNA-binding NarL/FixJ family response regulator